MSRIRPRFSLSLSKFYPSKERAFAHTLPLRIRLLAPGQFIRVNQRINLSFCFSFSFFLSLFFFFLSFDLIFVPEMIGIAAVMTNRQKKKTKMYYEVVLQYCEFLQGFGFCLFSSSQILLTQIHTIYKYIPSRTIIQP